MFTPQRPNTLYNPEQRGTYFQDACSARGDATLTLPPSVTLTFPAPHLRRRDDLGLLRQPPVKVRGEVFLVPGHPSPYREVSYRNLRLGEGGGAGRTVGRKATVRGGVSHAPGGRTADC